MLILTFLNVCRRIAANMGFFGLTFAASDLSGDFYLNFLLSMWFWSLFHSFDMTDESIIDLIALDLMKLSIWVVSWFRIVELPSYIIGIFAMDHFGRRITLSGCLFLSGSACLITGLIPNGDGSQYWLCFSCSCQECFIDIHFARIGLMKICRWLHWFRHLLVNSSSRALWPPFTATLPSCSPIHRESPWWDCVPCPAESEVFWHQNWNNW